MVGTGREKKGGGKTIFEMCSCTLENILYNSLYKIFYIKYYIYIYYIITKKATETKTDDKQDSPFNGAAKKDFYV